MSSDLISRQAAIDAVFNLDASHRVSWKDAVIDTIDALPPAQPEHKKGKWILPNNQIAVFLNEWICSECHYLIAGKHNYCPNCGAEMVKGEEDVRKSD